MDANVKPKSKSEIELQNRTTKSYYEIEPKNRNRTKKCCSIYCHSDVTWCHKNGRSQPKTKNFQPDYLQIPIPQLSTVSLLCNFCIFVICNCKMWKKVLWKCSKYLNVHWATNPLSYLSAQTHFYVQTHFGFSTWVLWVSVFFPRLFSVQNLAFCVT